MTANVRRMKKHNPDEIAALLLQYEDMTSRGDSQKSICSELGISVMTLHRWRKLSHSQDFSEPTKICDAGSGTAQLLEIDNGQVDKLKNENERLRRIVTDLLLEKIKIQEILSKNKK